MSANCTVDELFHALTLGDYDNARTLIRQGVDVNAKDNEGDTPLHKAAEGNAFDLAKLLISYGAHIDAKNNKDITPLDVAREAEHYKLAGVINASTQLLAAASDDNPEAIRYWLAEGADINVQDSKGATPLHRAVVVDSEVDILTQKMFNVKTVGLLHHCEHALIHAKDNWGNTPLHTAIIADKGDIAEWLINAGADVNAKNKYGVTPLHLTSKTEVYIDRNDERIGDLLIAYGADADTTTEAGDTPLHYAAYQSQYFAADRLLSSDANVNAKNNKGTTPLHLAVSKNAIDLADLLISNGADVYAEDSNGKTPLSIALALAKNYNKMANIILTSAESESKTKTSP